MRLTNRVAVVTGAGDGIGRACALAYAREGAVVVVNDVTLDATAGTIAQIEADGGRALAAPFAVGDEAAAEAIVTTALDAFGAIDVLVNNAAIGGDTAIESPQVEHAERSLRINLLGPILLVQQTVSRSMIPREYGRIINVTSRSGLRGKYGESIYAAGKAGLIGASLTWSLELMEHGITANCVAPAAWTRLLEIMPEPEKSNTIRKREKNSLRRVAMPDDLGPTFVFLASEESEYVTGQVLQATGQPSSLA